MIETEDILFLMPRDKEMQFPAMAALQMYVNYYQFKMQCNCVLPEPPEYQFRYKVEMDAEDWAFFQGLGIELKQDPVAEIGFPAQVIELTDDRLLHFQNSEKHCAQICAAVTGVEAPPFPKVVKPVGVTEFCGWILTDGCLMWDAAVLHRPDWVLSLFAIDEWVGGSIVLPDMPIMIGMQGRETYAACTLGLPVIEILPKRRSANWLSKWKHPLYRLVEEDQLDRIPDAIENLKAVLKFLADQQKVVETK